MGLMKRWLVLVLMIACAGHASAAPAPWQSPAKPADMPLPPEWLGVWKGATLSVTADGKKEEMPMELHVAGVPGGSARTWRILYGSGPAQTTRPYEILPVAGEPGRFVVDEKNGLFLDNQLVGNVLYSQFLVTTNLVTTRFEIKGDVINVEMMMFDVRSPRQSKLAGGSVEVSSYRFRSVQYGRLKKQP